MSALSYFNEPAPLAWDVAAAIFGATGEGGLYDPSALDTIFQDATGTTPAVPGSPVGLVLDKSGNSRNLSQPTTAARPTLQPPGLRFDLADDALTTTLPQAINGDILIAGTKGSIIEPVNYAAGSTFTLGPTSYTGGTPGIMRALGDIVGVVLIDRTLTQAERDTLIEHYKGRGAKGLLVPGPELVVNPTFENGTGWSSPSDTEERKRYYTEDGVVLWDGPGRPDGWNTSNQNMASVIFADDYPVLIEAEWTNDIKANGAIGAWANAGTHTFIPASANPEVGVRGTARAVVAISHYASKTFEMRPYIFGGPPYQTTFHRVSVRKLRPQEDW